MPRRWRFALLLLTLLSASCLSGCAAPPTNEISQAQQAVEAALAAGADRYAVAQYESAAKALKSAQEAVTQRDYRLALNHALDSREQARIAEKEALSQQTTLRTAAEHRLGEVTAILDRAKQKLVAAQAAGVPRRTLAGARTAIADAESSLQKAGTGIQEGNYLSSQQQLEDSAKKLESAIAGIEKSMKGRGQAGRTSG
jgi:hypothetical protein